MKTLGIASPTRHEIMLSFVLLALLGSFSGCSKSTDSPEQSIRENKPDEPEDVFENREDWIEESPGLYREPDRVNPLKAPSATAALIFEQRPLPRDWMVGGADPQDPRPGPANHDNEGIAKLFESWTGVVMPSPVEKLSYLHVLKSHEGSANHHISFTVPKELAEELLRQVATLDNPRFREVERPTEDTVLVVEPSSQRSRSRSIRMSKGSTYKVQLQPRWHRDDGLYIAIDIASGQVHCRRFDD